MVAANELRIGNWLKHTGDNIIRDDVKHTPVKLTMKDLSFIDAYPDNKYYEPIPLTPEILLKAGFVNAYSAFHDGRFIYNLKTFPTLHFQYDSDYNGIIVSNAEDHSLLIPCEYVHQLQNLYFALTGKELDIKL